MIKTLRIRNFQGHEDSYLEFGPGGNTIVGKNDSGKTSVVRDIIWVWKNRPLGDGIIRKGQTGNAFTSMEMDTCTVSREKGPKINQYTLSGVKDPYTGFGQNPPEDIIDALNFNDINIQTQLELPFLVLDSPGHVAQHIRSISGLDIVDKVTALLKSKLSTKTNLFSTQEEELKKTKGKLFELEKIDVKRMEELIQKAENLIEENKEIGVLESSLQKIVNELQDVEETWIVLPENVDSVLEKGTTAVSNLEQAKEQVSNLTSLLEELDSLEKEIVEIPEIKEDFISKIEAAEKQYNNMGERIWELEKILANLLSVEKGEKEITDQIKEEQDALFSLLDQITVCPFCTSKLTESTKRELLENY